MAEPEDTCYGFVYRLEDGETVGWFEESMDARAYSARKNKQHGKGTHDWAHTFTKPEIK